ncbi:DUF4845 domain-containing protein [Marinobacter sp. 1Y8]
MKTQRGASTLGILIAVLFFGSLVTLAIKLGPIYLDDITVQEALEGLDETENLGKMRKADIRKLIQKRMSVNNVREFDPKLIEIETEDGVVRLSLAYDRRTNLFQNIDAIVHFEHEYEMRGK